MTDLTKYEPIAESIATLFFPHVEVVIHDIVENRVAAIFNSFSRRKPGDNSGIENLQGLAIGAPVQGPFEKQDANGRRIRYTSSVLRSDEGTPIGMMCINFNVSVLGDIQIAIQSLLGSPVDSTKFDQLFDDDWQTRINAFVSDYLHKMHRNLSTLLPAERAELVTALHAAGAFRAKKAASHVASVLGISRATVYKYLSQAGQELEGRS
jgi:D-arginine utilization repressor